MSSLFFKIFIPSSFFLTFRNSADVVLYFGEVRNWYWAFYTASHKVITSLIKVELQDNPSESCNTRKTTKSNTSLTIIFK